MSATIGSRLDDSMHSKVVRMSSVNAQKRISECERERERLQPSHTSILCFYFSTIASDTFAAVAVAGLSLPDFPPQMWR